MAVECNARTGDNQGYYVTCPHGRGKASPKACKKCQGDDLQVGFTVPVAEGKPATDLLRSRLALEIAVRKLSGPTEGLGLPDSQGMTVLEWVERDLAAWTVDFAKEPITARLEQLAKMLMIPPVFLTHIVANSCSERFADVVGRRMVEDIPALKSTPLGTIRPVSQPTHNKVDRGKDPRKQIVRKKWKLPASQFCEEWPDDMSLAEYAAMRLDEAAATGTKGAVAKAGRKIAEKVNKTTGTEMCDDADVLSFARKHRVLLTAHACYNFLDLPASEFGPEWSEWDCSFRQALVRKFRSTESLKEVLDLARSALEPKGYVMGRRALRNVIAEAQR